MTAMSEASRTDGTEKRGRKHTCGETQPHLIRGSLLRPHRPVTHKLIGKPNQSLAAMCHSSLAAGWTDLGFLALLQSWSGRLAERRARHKQGSR